MAHRPRLHWCPTGPFTSAPLHAAGVYDGPKSERISCADFVVSSYTPTLTTLLRAQRSIVSLTKQELDLMLVAEDRSQEQLPIIPGVSLELTVVAGIAISNNVHIIGHTAGSTTVSETFNAVQAANIAHIACHGVQDRIDATRSGFCLGDGRLTISDLIKMDIKQGFLAFLSACETARGSDDQPDQAMHLAAAMLFAGFKSVIATMWSVQGSFLVDGS
jgi:CHAT domain-containing protein